MMHRKACLSSAAMVFALSCSADDLNSHEGLNDGSTGEANLATSSDQDFPSTWTVYRNRGGENIDVFMAEDKIVSRSTLGASTEEIANAHFGGPYERDCDSGMVCSSYPEFIFDQTRLGSTISDNGLSCDSSRNLEGMIEIECRLEQNEPLEISIVFSESQGILSYTRAWGGNSETYDLISGTGLYANTQFE